MSRASRLSAARGQTHNARHAANVARDKLNRIAAERDKLREDLEESDAIRDRCAHLLAETAVALKGPEEALQRHGWQDLAEVAAKLRTEHAQQAERIATLEAENERLGKDSEMLDWLSEHPDAVVVNEGPYGPYHVWFRYSNRTTETRKTHREAIDAAMLELSRC